mmetsp:Transcript_948/g.2532  ORF Transcript_948/g.2532 Transcript_948/m.2532 type:complete len:223 (-) Transcript_948:181-849(-)
MRADPLPPLRAHLRRPHRQRLLVAHKDAGVAESCAREGNAHPLPRHILVEVVSRRDEAGGHAGRVRVVPVDLESCGVVRLAGRLGRLPRTLCRHVVKRLGLRLVRARRAARVRSLGVRGVVELLELRRDPLPHVVHILADAAIRAERWQTHWNILGVDREKRTETRARGDVHGLSRGHLNVAMRRSRGHLDGDMARENTDPLVVMKRQPRLACATLGLDQRD